MIVYLTATPSDNTRKAIKVIAFCQKRLVESVIENRPGRKCLMEVASCKQGGFTSSGCTHTWSLKETDFVAMGKYKISFVTIYG